MVAFRATPATGSNGSLVTSVTISKQAGTAPGDQIFLWVPVSGSSTSGAPASCPGFAATTGNASGSGFTGNLLYRQADGTEGSSFMVTFGSGTYAYVIATIQAAVLDTTGTIGTGGSGGTIAAPSITASQSGWVLWFCGIFNNTAPPVPAGFTTDAAVSNFSGACSLSSGHDPSLGAGPTGSQTVSTGGNFSAVAVLAAVYAPQNRALIVPNPQAVRRASTW